MRTSPSNRFGPLWLAPGVTRLNVMANFYASFVIIGMLTGMGFLSGYILIEHLHIPTAQQGEITGNLGFWSEVVVILLVNPFGILSDRIGRRPVLIIGILIIGIAYGLYPFATSATELLIYRCIFGAGAAATASMIAALMNDYPAERSRGKMIGFSSLMNVLGVMLIALGLGQLPPVLQAHGLDAVTAGRVVFLLAAILCLVSAIIFRIGLKGGAAVSGSSKAGLKVLFGSGARAILNPRIALSYALAFTARGDVVIKGLFLSLWAIHDGREWGLNPGEAMARFGLILGLMQLIGIVWQPVFGWLMDHVNRVTAVIIALAFASTGYLSMGQITSPLDFTKLPAFAVLTIGTSSAMMASTALLGQESPAPERGAIMAMNGLFGSIGIMIFTKGGGIWFDTWGPWAPFVIIGAVQIVLLLLAILVRVIAPGRDPGELQSA